MRQSANRQAYIIHKRNWGALDITKLDNSFLEFNELNELFPDPLLITGRPQICHDGFLRFGA